jgi:hypothetical protein
MIDLPATILVQQSDPDPAWRAARHRVLLRADLKCEQCGAEDDRRVWHYLYEPRWWAPIVPGQRRVRRHDREWPVEMFAAVTVKVVVAPRVTPWQSDDDLQVLCFGCWIETEVERARTVATRPTGPRVGRLPL